MKRNKKTLYTIILILVVIIISLSIAFAALSTTLIVNFASVNQNAYTWNVQFDTGTTNVAPTKNSTNQSSNFTCDNATVSASSVTVSNVKLSKPGDYCIWAFKVDNYGTMPAKLTNISSSKAGTGSCTTSGATITCGCVTFKLAKNTAGSTLVTTSNTSLAAGSSTTPTQLQLYLRADYTPTTVAQVNACAAQTNTNLTYTLTWGTN